MHIVYVTTELATKNNSSGGLASYVANMSRIFASHGHKVTIVLVTTKEFTVEFEPEIRVVNVFVEKSKWDEISDVAELSIYNTPKSLKMSGYKSILLYVYKSKIAFEKINEIHKEDPIDIIQATNLGFLSCQFDDTIPYVVRMSSFLNLCDAANKQVVDSDCGLHRMSLINKVHLDVIRENRFTISPSFFLKQIAEQEYGFSPVVLESPFLLKEDDWNENTYNKMLKGKKYVLHFGSLKYLKGIHIVADIAECLLEKYPDMYLVLAGYDSCLDIADGQQIMASELVMRKAGKYADRVIYVGRPVREELYPIIKYAEVCLLPSRIENLSNACIEAMAMGKIVVATDGASYEQLIKNHFNGFLCERDNSSSFLIGLEEAIELTSEQKRIMSERAKMIVERLNPEKIYNKYLEYYKKVIAEWNY